MKGVRCVGGVRGMCDKCGGDMGIGLSKAHKSILILCIEHNIHLHTLIPASGNSTC